MPISSSLLDGVSCLEREPDILNRPEKLFQTPEIFSLCGGDLGSRIADSIILLSSSESLGLVLGFL